MKIGIKVGDLMTRTFISIGPDVTIVKCAEEMKKHRIGSLIVREGDRLSGIVTEGDMINAIARKKDLSKTPVREIMTKNVITVRPEVDIYDALVLMKRKKVRWLPVAVGDKVIGMLTMKDILRIEPTLFDIVAESTEIKEIKEKLRAAKLRRERAELVRGMMWIREGECEECGAYGILFNMEGRLLCEDCKDTLTR